jgi:cytochrome c oxidase assembly protein subunit 15
MAAYAIWLLATLHAVDAWRSRAGHIVVGAAALAVLVTAQAALGIVTLVSVAPLGLSLGHQAFAIVVLTMSVVHAENLHASARAATVPCSYPLQHGAKAT